MKVLPILIVLTVIFFLGYSMGGDPSTPEPEVIVRTIVVTTTSTSTTLPVTCWIEGHQLRTGSAEKEELGC